MLLRFIQAIIKLLRKLEIFCLNLGVFFYYFDNLLYPTILIALSNVRLNLLADISNSWKNPSCCILIWFCIIHVNLRRSQIILNVCIVILIPLVFVWRISWSSLMQSTIEGLSLLSVLTQRDARLANMVIDSIVYELLLISGSITLRSFFLSFNMCLTCGIRKAVDVTLHIEKISNEFHFLNNFPIWC